MSTESGNSVIHRKARHGREDFDARAMSPSKALRLSLELSGDRLFDLALAVCAVEHRMLVHASLKDEVGGDRLIVLLDGEAGARGAVLFDRPFVQALVEIQTMGRVTNTAGPERLFTSTDAAVTKPLVDAVLTGFDEKLFEADEQHQPLGFRFGDRVEDARVLMLALEAPEYQLFRVTVDIGFGSKSGELTLLLPSLVSKRSDPSAPVGSEGAEFDLTELAMTAPVLLNAVLDQVQLPLAQVCALKPGMNLPVSAAAINRTKLVTTHGHVVAQVRLGQLNGFRAVRLLTGGDSLHNPNDPATSDGGRVPDEDADQPRPPRLDYVGVPEAKGLPEQLSFGTGSSESDATSLLTSTSDLPGSMDNGAGVLPDLPELPGLPDLPAIGD